MHESLWGKPGSQSKGTIFGSGNLQWATDSPLLRNSSDSVESNAMPPSSGHGVVKVGDFHERRDRGVCHCLKEDM